MPEPVAWLLYHPATRLSMAVVERTEDYRLSDGSVVYTSSPLVLKSRAEAYAAAKVREALEEAAKACDAYFKETEEQSRSTYEEGKLDAADILEQRILALIPSQTGDSNVATD